MKRTGLVAVIGALAVVSSAAPAESKTMFGKATVLGRDGSVKGSLRLTGDGRGVEIKLDVAGLPPGAHGVHLHAVGSCTAPDYASAGPHLNPTMHGHGTLNPQGSHLGDLPNLEVDNSGSGSLSARITGTPAELGAILFDGDGTAVVVHAAADDYRTDPSGNSGSRIACGVITRNR
jgi:Cu-Zn family superoxide dismutase